MRVAIREQLAVLVIFAVLVALAVVSIPTWIYVNKFVIDVESSGLALTASLKAARISSEIDLIQTTCENIATRILIQTSISDFYNGNDSDTNWDSTRIDLNSALNSSGSSGIFQVRIFSRNTTGDPHGLLNVTGQIGDNIILPYRDTFGHTIILSDTPDGYPPVLYPNITYIDSGVPNPVHNSTHSFTAYAYSDTRLTNGLLLGPLIINATFALISVTVPIRQNGFSNYNLGYITLVASAQSLNDIVESREGLGETGSVLIISPDTQSNHFNGSTPPSNQSYIPPDLDQFGDIPVHFIFPPQYSGSGSDRHSQHEYSSGGYGHMFNLSAYPAALDVFTTRTATVNNASSTLDTNNEQGYSVAVGVARPQTTLVTWAVVVEQDRQEALQPIVTLQHILLGCVFGTAGLILLLIFPCAHLSVKPIRQLKSATEKSIAPPGFAEGAGGEDEIPSSGTRSSTSRISEKGWFLKLRRKVGLPKKPPPRHENDERQVFKIPGKVPEKKHLITDELTELTATFNAMSDELLKQYEFLDEKVAERTKELELSKKAAEAANESKTLFIANISHELKTPLNGIMGMCAVCMEEDDIVRIKQSLKTVYKSGKVPPAAEHWSKTTSLTICRRPPPKSPRGSSQLLEEPDWPSG